MKKILRKNIYEKHFREILDTETHHSHKIVKNSDGKLTWEENPDTRSILNKVSINDIVALLVSLGYDKNSEVYRKLYRDMGYTLNEYWEIFYWDMNNPDVKKYRPKKY